VGIFKIFKKKPIAETIDSTANVSSKKIKAKPNVVERNNGDEGFSHSVITEKRHIARATERKIDAIEFEMSRDMGRSKTSKATLENPSELLKRTAKNQFHTDFIASEFQSTIALTSQSTELILGHNTGTPNLQLFQSESVPLLEEAAILFASGQKIVSEHMLKSAIEQDHLGSAMHSAWFMLFDLYQIDHNQAAFDGLCLEYAKKFEASPPVWKFLSSKAGEVATTIVNAAIPSVTFSKQLDSNSMKLIQKMVTLSEKSKTLRLDFGHVLNVDPVGCGLLLRAIKNLQKTKHDLVVVGAQNLTEQIRAILQVGRRDETEAPWLLLLEVLQLLQLKEAFEEASIDYCVTFEVSPPAYVAPTSKVTTTLEEIIEFEEESEQYQMPITIEGKTNLLIFEIEEYAKTHDTVILDCSKLERVEFGASAQLLNGLVPISNAKKPIEFHEVNYLVLHLFNAMGLKNIATIYPRKQF
jgi:ABC-type transporter Mla MlaB component